MGQAVAIGSYPVYFAGGSNPNEDLTADNALKDAKRYGATSVLLVPGVARNGVSYADCFKRSVVEIRKAVPVAQELGVKIAVENVWNDFITKPEQAVEFLEAIGSPQVGWHF